MSEHVAEPEESLGEEGAVVKEVVLAGKVYMWEDLDPGLVVDSIGGVQGGWDVGLEALLKVGEVGDVAF